MLKYTSILLLTGSCLITSVSADIQWGQFVGAANGAADNYKQLDFTSNGSGSQYTTFSNVNGTGLDLRMTVTGTGFQGAAIATLHYGYSAPVYQYGYNQWGGSLGNSAANLGLVFTSAFAEKGQTYTVTFEVYNGSERVVVDGSNFTIYGIGTQQPHTGWLPGWGLQGYRDVVSNINAKYDGDTIYGRHGSLIPGNADASDYVRVDTTSGISNPNAASSAGIDQTEYGFQQGIYYGTTADGDNNSNNQGNITVSYNAPVESISFTFGNSNDQNVAQNNSSKQFFGIGGFNFGDQYIIPDNGGGAYVPEPSTYALLLALGVAAVVIIRRRK